MVLDAEHAEGVVGARARDAEARVGVGRVAVGERLEAAPERRRLGAPGVDEEPAAALGEGGELRAERLHLAVVPADVVHDADRGAVADERAVGLASLGDDGALGGTGAEAPARAVADERGAAEHGGGHARLAQEPRQHPDDRALAARARDGDAGHAGIHHLR